MNATFKWKRTLLPIALIGGILSSSGCRAPLPRLEHYGSASNGQWNIVEEDDLESTLKRLEDHPDAGVQEGARTVRSSITSLEQERSRRISGLQKEHDAENELLAEVIMVEVDYSRLPGGGKPEDLREELYLRALEAEESGQLALAMDYASVASAIELYTPGLAEGLDQNERATKMQRRLNRRFDLIRIASPELARRLLDEEYEEGDDRAAEAKEDPPDTRVGLNNAAILMELLHQKHVDDPEMADLHQAGLDEVLTICELLALHESPGAEVMLEKIRAAPIDPRSDRTMAIILELNRIQKECPEAALPEQFLVRTFVEGAAGALDKRTTLIWPDEHARYMRNFGRKYRGMGAKITPANGGGIEINPISGGPAARAGIRSGDVMEKVDGTSIDHMSIEELSLVTTDPERETIELQLTRKKDGSPYSVVVKLDSVLVPHVSGWTQTGVGGDGSPTWNWLADDDARIAYVRLDGFRPDGDRAIRIALREAQHQSREVGGRLEGLVLDLRMNPGGQVDIAEEVANMFMRRGTIFRSTDGRRRIDNETAKNAHSELAGMPLVILVDERSASASELVSGLLQVRADALVIGDRTYGKGSIQSPMRAMTNDCMAVVTTGWYLLPRMGAGEYEDWRYVDRDRNQMEWGVIPDISMPMSFAETAEALDHRTRWYSGLDLDRMPQGDETPDGPADPATEMALTLLRARILDARTDEISARRELVP
ncbi:MAG: S41 family peptidase [Phycisphaerales bacterium]|nr:S41 family peptidase [Phycisphaerales bacterium]